MVIPADALTLAQAAAICGLSPSTLRWQIRNGRLRAVKAGHDYLTTRAWLDEYLASRPNDRRRRIAETRDCNVPQPGGQT